MAGGKTHDRRPSSAPLFAEDCYLREFDAEVIIAGPRFAVLDRTAFYPESGGQPCDTGYLKAGDREIRVNRVIRRGWDIFHYLDGDVILHTEVHGVIDWEPRFFNMRRHSAEHLLTGLFEEANAGPKVYSDLGRLEFQPSSLTDEVVRRVGDRFNEVVDNDVPVRIFYMDRGELEVGGDERKASFLEKIPRDVQRLRMVEILGFALTFCFGTHVSRTGEIGRLSSLTLEEGRKGKKTVRFNLSKT